MKKRAQQLAQVVVAVVLLSIDVAPISFVALVLLIKTSAQSAWHATRH
jgi:hypothetical protein